MACSFTLVYLTIAGGGVASAEFNLSVHVTRNTVWLKYAGTHGLLLKASWLQRRTQAAPLQFHGHMLLTPLSFAMRRTFTLCVNLTCVCKSSLLSCSHAGNLIPIKQFSTVFQSGWWMEFTIGFI